ncbi:MAG: S1 RNA-binding domain-containing protein [Bacillota bacterium]|jgi:S1 RNA binding domain protein
MTLAEGNIVEGVVTGITNFGAFVKLEDGSTGLVHISEVADSYVKEIADFLKEGDKVKVKILNIGDNKKIGLSIKQAKPKPVPKPAPKPFVQSGGFGSVSKKNSSFEDKLAEFMKDSNEKLVALKRHQEGRRR